MITLKHKSAMSNNDSVNDSYQGDIPVSQDYNQPDQTVYVPTTRILNTQPKLGMTQLPNPLRVFNTIIIDQI